MIHQQDTLKDIRNQYLSIQELDTLKQIQDLDKPYLNIEDLLR